MPSLALTSWRDDWRYRRDVALKVDEAHGGTMWVNEGASKPGGEKVEPETCFAAAQDGARNESVLTKLAREFLAQKALKPG